MTNNNLSDICRSCGIPSRPIGEEAIDFYRDNRPAEETLVHYMAEIDALLNGNVVVMGGFCACSSVFGFRPMRRTSNDLDCVTDESGIRTLKSRFNGGLFQTVEHGDVFLDYNGIPICFDVGETHSWDIPQSLAYEARRVEFDFGGFNAISPELLIALKARRSILKGRFFGKDAVDTANILMAPLFRSDLERINFRRVRDFMRRYVSDSIDVPLSYLSFVEGYESNLRHCERPAFQGVMSLLKDAVEQAYGVSPDSSD